jgi:hypothetical protein
MSTKMGDNFNSSRMRRINTNVSVTISVVAFFRPKPRLSEMGVFDNSFGIKGQNAMLYMHFLHVMAEINGMSNKN